MHTRQKPCYNTEVANKNELPVELKGITKDSAQVQTKLGQLIKARRKQLYPKDTQEVFAARIGVGETTMSKIENGKPGVAWNTVFDCLILLNMQSNIEALLSDELQTSLKANTSW